MSGASFVLAVLFLTIVAPLWIIFHYVTKWRSARGLSAEDERMLADLWESAGRMENRIGSLEKILDSEAPGWRTRQ
ncbi:phage shock protein B [Skermanella aerolata]|jgi:phage shock protein B|uniref:Phage shock protein B n=1 Tax=Skermanella aerolata TaxID=393310 RepID=A0A512DKY5_9PROT|nr:envelope stress response membrane protein PspB [Skermanella aerolata]KJB92286.1 phage-shock protein [Skermanella aerolata KACC 11604]GEO37105.1 phage shock protein B [Skermanella aerolata]